MKLSNGLFAVTLLAGLAITGSANAYSNNVVIPSLESLTQPVDGEQSILHGPILDNLEESTVQQQMEKSVS